MKKFTSSKISIYLGLLFVLGVSIIFLKYHSYDSFLGGVIPWDKFDDRALIFSLFLVSYISIFIIFVISEVFLRKIAEKNAFTKTYYLLFPFTVAGISILLFTITASFSTTFLVPCSDLCGIELVLYPIFIGPVIVGYGILRIGLLHLYVARGWFIGLVKVFDLIFTFFERHFRIIAKIIIGLSVTLLIIAYIDYATEGTVYKFSSESNYKVLTSKAVAANSLVECEKFKNLHLPKKGGEYFCFKEVFESQLKGGVEMGEYNSIKSFFEDQCAIVTQSRKVSCASAAALAPTKALMKEIESQVVGDIYKVKTDGEKGVWLYNGKSVRFRGADYVTSDIESKIGNLIRDVNLFDEGILIEDVTRESVRGGDKNIRLVIITFPRTGECSVPKDFVKTGGGTASITSVHNMETNIHYLSVIADLDWLVCEKERLYDVYNNVVYPIFVTIDS